VSFQVLLEIKVVVAGLQMHDSKYDRAAYLAYPKQTPENTEELSFHYLYSMPMQHLA